jgi:mannose-6-phosphate isomerase-like protein (cupin superfamily)
MQAVLLEQLLRDRRRDSVHYREFLRVPALSAGLYTLPAGGVDPQTPHAEDEVYHVVQGRAVLRVEATEIAVVPGSIVHVPAGVPHRFHSITEELVALVWFAPAESSGAPRC